MSKVEEVARALCWANGQDPDLSLGGDKQNWLWMEYEHQAKRAIAAMREPSDWMVRHGVPPLERRMDLAQVYNAMIDAALQE